MSPCTFGRRVLLAAATLLPSAARAALPDRPLRLIVGFAAGTGPDLLARNLADALREAVPAGVIIDNRPGAGGLIAAQEVAKATPADGSTLLLGGVGPLAIAPSIYPRLAYDPLRDLAAVAHLAAADFALVVPNSLPVTGFDDYLRWGKGRDQLFMGTFGPGTPGHFGAAMLRPAARLPVESVHFRTTGDAMSAILGGNVEGLFGTVALVVPYVRAGQLKALAVTSQSRSALLADTPTMIELGYPDLTFNSWFGIAAPRATPPAVLDALEAAVLRAMASPGLESRLQEAGLRPSVTGRAAFGAFVQQETTRWAEVVRATQFRALE